MGNVGLVLSNAFVGFPELGFLSSSVSYLYSTVKNLLLLLYCKICYFLRKPKVILTLIVFIDFFYGGVEVP